MRAIVQSKYGGSEVLQLKEFYKPQPQKNEVLVKVMAAAINDYDWCHMRGEPYLYRLMFGLFKPKQKVPGMEFAGVVEELGVDVSNFAVGDAVYGDISECGFGAFAEYACVNETALVHKPKFMSFIDAASIPHAALLASQGLIDLGQIKQGQKVLINGAGGGVGTFAFCIAKQFGAEVTGVDSGQKLKVLSELGFDHAIDYKQQDFTSTGICYDLILDTKTNRPPKHYLRCLKPNGKYITVGGELFRLLQIVLSKKRVFKHHQKTIDVLSLKSNKGLEYIEDLYREGMIKSLIDGPYKLEEVPRLIQYFGEGRHKGKIVVQP